MDLLLLFKALILGLVEGATEFLPVSSTGHLIIAGELLNFNNENGKIFEIVIQLGAILAVCWEYRAKISHVFANVFTEAKSQQLIVNLVLALMPAVIIGVPLHHFIKEHLFTPITVACGLIIGGIAILLIERFAPLPDTPTVDDMDWKHALKIGFAQTLALIPGVSRSGATILGGTVFGLSRYAATEFSFFLAIPVMFGATGLEVFANPTIYTWQYIDIIAVGFVTAFFSALLVTKGLLRFVSTHDFKGFAWYRIIFGIAILLYFW